MPQIRIATYNIHKARGMDGRVRVARIARVLEDIDADVIAMQEVVSESDAGAERHQAQYLADHLGYFWTVGETRRHRGGIYGNVTLSRWPFERTHHIDLSVPRREPRGALRTDIRVGAHLLHVFNVHLGTARRERTAQATLIERHLLRALDLSGPRVVLGDFNDWLHGQVTRTLTAAFHLADIRDHLKRTRAYPALLPLVHLDHIYLDRHFRIRRAHFERTRRTLMASDHLPLIADVTLGPDRGSPA